MGPLLTEQGCILQELGDGLQPQCQLPEKACGERGETQDSQRERDGGELKMEFDEKGSRD